MENIIGHQEQWQRLNSLYETGKLTPAWMLTGPQGIGKATFAKALATHIFTQAGHANVQRQMNSGVFPNYKLISDADGGITIDKLRPILDFLHFKAHLPGWRIIIVDAADSMNRFSANALLKSLEEPPAQTLLMLITHQPGRILPTLRSRCLKINFQKLAAQQVAASLDLPLANPAIQIADGRLGYAKTLHEIGLPGKFAELLNHITAFLCNRAPIPANFLKSFAKDNKEQLKYLLDIWQWWIYQLAQPDSHSIVIWPEDYQAQRSAANQQHWVEVYRQLSHLFDRANRCHLDNFHVLLCAIETMKNPEIYNVA